jgi:hypothetical protein
MNLQKIKCKCCFKEIEVDLDAPGYRAVCELCWHSMNDDGNETTKFIPSGSCMICGVDKLFAVWPAAHPEYGVCLECREAARRGVTACTVFRDPLANGDVTLGGVSVTPRTRAAELRAERCGNLAGATKILVLNAAQLESELDALREAIESAMQPLLAMDSPAALRREEFLEHCRRDARVILREALNQTKGE